ncbi:AroM family protein [Sedimentibacter hydroxybenzoicus DSM 7310]|uniref:AroM family protein n=1 Tax=Sedimentibacter hydroxybenzoicus DSM 7310 TaxID=1123245 RepID=A0A974GWN1_SEDHY|nr:AroM family protein [Sedimentibacter hydroxybenzoicus]NYB74677.1 AroM family protein [Sedimentibacter hydroxybenzoicus DSM 7310]
MNKKAAMITMGHSPRTDIIPDISALLNNHINIVHAGVMDEFSCEYIRKEFIPATDEEPFVSKLKDGRMHAFSRNAAMDLLQNKIDLYCQQDTAAIVLLCTSKFDNIKCSVPLIEPYKLLHNTVKSIDSGMKISAVFPFESHFISMKESWEQDIKLNDSICINPSDSLGCSNIISHFQHDKPDLLILDCLGYTNEWRETISEGLNIPIVHPRTLIAGLLNNIL